MNFSGQQNFNYTYAHDGNIWTKNGIKIRQRSSGDEQVKERLKW